MNDWNYKNIFTKFKINNKRFRSFKNKIKVSF